jgi:hypothetical protein
MASKTQHNGWVVHPSLWFDALEHGRFDPAVASYADFVANALTGEGRWPGDLGARYLELTGTR